MHLVYIDTMEVHQLKSSNLEIKEIKKQLAGLSEKHSEVLATEWPVGQDLGVNRQSTFTIPQKSVGASPNQ